MPNYSPQIKSELEAYWTEKQSQNNNQTNEGQKMYILSMFPYPSGQLHMGHMRVYTTADVLVRYNRLLGKNVIFPMGWDSFGLPAENAAIEKGHEPQIWTVQNIEEMKHQMKEQMSLSIDWKREISTSDKDYYKWTQWIFCRLYENGLAYQRSEMVNWDPVDRTVLADELIDNTGRSWRSGAIVKKVPLKQWFIRTTALSQSLIKGFEHIQGQLWRSVVEMQKGWLGNLEGVYMDFDLVDVKAGNKFVDRISVYTNQPVAALSGFVSFVEINPENIWWNYKDDHFDETSITAKFHPMLAVKHPLSGKLIPILKNRNLTFKREDCLTARLGFPLIDFNDAKIAGKFEIPFSSVTLGAYNRIRGSLWPPSEGMQLDNNLETILNEKSLQTLQKLRRGGFLCSKLRTDWLISRQRYWGTPIPIIHCSSCGPVLVEDSKLPVELPSYSECQAIRTTDNVTSPLAFASDWVKVDCPKCGNPEAQRETDTMDTFVDSSWYFLRFLDPSNSSYPCSQEVVKEKMPVDLYIGGIEHSIRHLYYARFISHFLHHYTDLKLPNGPEPFTQFLPIGLLLGETYQTKSGKFIPNNEVKYIDGKPVHSETEEVLTMSWDKMSKSKFNGVCPKFVVQKYGLDSTRLIMLSNTGPDKVRRWQENDVVLGVQNWEKKIWNMIMKVVNCPVSNVHDFYGEDVLLNDQQFIKYYQYVSTRILFQYEKTFTISVIISSLQKLTSILSKSSTNNQTLHSILYHRVLLNFLVYLYPISPLLASELWAQLSTVLLPVESAFVETEQTYTAILGPWNYNLSLEIWNQRLSDHFVEVSSDTDSVNIVNN